MKPIKCKLCGGNHLVHVDEKPVHSVEDVVVSQPEKVVSRTKQSRWRERNKVRVRVNHTEYMRKKRSKA